MTSLLSRLTQFSNAFVISDKSSHLWSPLNLNITTTAYVKYNNILLLLLVADFNICCYYKLASLLNKIERYSLITYG